MDAQLLSLVTDSQYSAENLGTQERTQLPTVCITQGEDRTGEPIQQAVEYNAK